MVSRPTLFSAPGGDTQQALETANQLRALKVTVDIKLSNEVNDYDNYDIVHFFNVIRPNVITPHLNKIKCPFVLSTIYVDYSEIEVKQSQGLRKWLFQYFGKDRVEYLKTIARWTKNGEPLMDYNYLFRGHKKSVELVLTKAAMLLPNSESELNRLKTSYLFSNSHRVIPNGVSEKLIDININHELKKNVVCVGRIEPLKNQLKLIEALNNSDFNLKLIGKPAPNHIDYFKKCKSVANSNVEFMGQLPKEAVEEELKKAKVHVLPSWFETTGLSSLEAAALECNLVITDKGDTKDYFENMATYCDPSDSASIRAAVFKAYEKTYSPELKDKIREEYLWVNAAELTLKAYLKVLQ
jgi:glycosyltransferase involved in cell wall biosynthesis